MVIEGVFDSPRTAVGTVLTWGCISERIIASALFTAHQQQLVGDPNASGVPVRYVCVSGVGFALSHETAIGPTPKFLLPFGGCKGGEDHHGDLSSVATI